MLTGAAWKHTQKLGDAWLDGCNELILVVPSVIMPIASAPDRNVLINHRHSGSDRITIAAVTPFTFDAAFPTVIVEPQQSIVT